MNIYEKKMEKIRVATFQAWAKVNVTARKRNQRDCKRTLNHLVFIYKLSAFYSKPCRGYQAYFDTDNEPSAQLSRRIKCRKQSYIAVSAAFSIYPISNEEHQPRCDKVVYAISGDKFINFTGDSFSKRGNLNTPCQCSRQKNPRILKDNLS